MTIDEALKIHEKADLLIEKLNNTKFICTRCKALKHQVFSTKDKHIIRCKSCAHAATLEITID